MYVPASPSYLALTYDLVGREDLANAVALNLTQFQLSRVVGPALAGVAFACLDLRVAFLLTVFPLSRCGGALDGANGSSIRFRCAGSKGKLAIWRDIAEGFVYVRNRPRVSSLLLLAAVNSLFGAPYFTLVPIYARDIFHLGETGLALMMGTSGGGAFLGALLVAFLGDFRRKGWFVLGGAIFLVCASRALRCRTG